MSFSINFNKSCAVKILLSVVDIIYYKLHHSKSTTEILANVDGQNQVPNECKITKSDICSFICNKDMHEKFKR